MVYSVKKKSEISGAQYLHEPIPGLTSIEPDGQVNYIKHGTRDGYAEKVYGSRQAPCSWDNFATGKVNAWKMEAVYDKLWQAYYPVIQEEIIEPSMVPILLDENDMVISTIPKPQLCEHGHEFLHKSIWIADYNSLPFDVNENVVLYNGDPLDHWYRASRLWGHEATESTVPMAGARPGIKPISTTCTCFSDKVVFAGRFGKWEKGVLVHDAYHTAREAMNAVQPV